MEVADHYIQLRMTFSNVHDEEELHTTIGELAQHLCCTMRNMNLIMNKFMDNNWIQWNPKRGRGKKSVLVFCVPLLEVARERFDRLLQGNRLEEAYELAARLPFSLREMLMQGLQDQFGLRSDQGAMGRIDTLRIPQNFPFETLDPTQAAMWGEVGIVAEVFDRLVRYNAERQMCEPSLAVAWESNPEGTEWTFYLHKGVLFHHGRVLEADDVKFTFERIILDIDNPCRPLFGTIAKIETFDALTVRFVLHNPNFMFPDLMSSMCASILPRDVEPDRMHPIGTGPYRLTRNHPRLLVLDVFPSYFRGRAYIDRVEVWQLPQSGLMESVIKQDLFPDGQPHAVQHEVQGGVYMTFNMRKEGPQQDIYFRRAVQQLLNQQEMMDAFPGTGTQPAYSLVREHFWEPTDAEIVGCSIQQKRPETLESNTRTSLIRAEELLKRSSYAGQTLRLWVEDGKKMETDMLWFVQRCEQIGLHVTVVPGDPVSAVYHDEFGSCDLVYTGEVFDEHAMLGLLTMYTFQNTLFLVAMDDVWKRELDQECRRIVGIQDGGERLGALLELEARLVDEALLLPAYSFREEHAHHPSLRDYKVVGFGMPDLRRLWVKRKPDAKNEETSYPAYIPLW
ncbi:ABC transporter substrate-binding protein [Paenibacillus xylanilyticus]|uniref:ABC transporter substrate-binding protein n=1 Tax=Paenibacillus xylanilyticus TaxID=248903 RepID=A0A7Y6EYE2_9BACL|nr:ABC transporter substrate-binding protein [Paenibacillus xylanilyticus]NUU78639.1 hypothetical protein [Paenibacillus xylanilyticus]